MKHTPYHLSYGASQGNAFTAHLTGDTQINWSGNNTSAILSAKSRARHDASVAAGGSLGTIRGLSPKADAQIHRVNLADKLVPKESTSAAMARRDRARKARI